MGAWAKPIKRLRALLAGSGGTTLMEVLVAVGLISAASGIVGAGIFRVTSIQRFWSDDVIATKDLRHAGSWLAGDAINAEDALDAGGTTRLTCDPVPAEHETNLTWTSSDGSTHTAHYAVVQGALIRTMDGAQLTLATNVVDQSPTFSLCGDFLTLTLAVEASRNATETLSLRTRLRKLQ